MEKLQNNYLGYIHNFRGFAIILIVAVHTFSSFSWDGNILVENFWFTLLAFATIHFVFISGFLFQHLSSKCFDFKKYILQKVKFVLLPYFIVSIPGLVNKLYFDTYSPWMPKIFIDKPAWTKIIYMLSTGKHFGPLWFIPMIFIIYLLAPLLLRLDKMRNFYIYIFPFIFFAGLLTYKFGHYYSTMQSLFYFLPVYFWGMFASKFKDNILNSGKRIFVPLICIYVFITLFEIYEIIPIDKTYGYDTMKQEMFYPLNFSKLKVCLLSIFFLQIFYELRNRKQQIFNILGTYSFGIYFIHLFLIRFVEKLIPVFFDKFHFNGYYFPLYVIIVLLLTFAIVFLIKRIFGKNSRYLIGS